MLDSNTRRIRCVWYGDSSGVSDYTFGGQCQKGRMGLGSKDRTCRVTVSMGNLNRCRTYEIWAFVLGEKKIAHFDKIDTLATNTKEMAVNLKKHVEKVAARSSDTEKSLQSLKQKVNTPKGRYHQRPGDQRH